MLQVLLISSPALPRGLQSSQRPCFPSSHSHHVPISFPGFLLACFPHTSSYPESLVPCRRSELNHTNWPLTDPPRSCWSSWINTTTWRPPSHRLEVSENTHWVFPLNLPSLWGAKKRHLPSSPSSPLDRNSFIQLSSGVGSGDTISHPGAVSLSSHLFLFFILDCCVHLKACLYTKHKSVPFHLFIFT